MESSNEFDDVRCAAGFQRRLPPDDGKPVSHRKDKQERLAIVLLEKVVDLDRADRDALPGSAVKKVKEALKILRKLQKGRK